MEKKAPSTVSPIVLARSCFFWPKKTKKASGEGTVKEVPWEKKSKCTQRYDNGTNFFIHSPLFSPFLGVYIFFSNAFLHGSTSQ